MATSTARLAGGASYKWGAVTLFFAAAVILAALGFEYIGGFDPCELCLEQRYAYYIGTPLLFLSLVLLSAGQTRLAAGLFLLVSLLFLANAGLGVYHAGVEWKFWEGPQACSGSGLKPLAGSGSLMKDLAGRAVASCVEPQIRILGLSFAGWNVVACVALFFGALKAAFAASES